MKEIGPTIAVPPRLGLLLTQVTQTPDLETALWKILSEHIDLKIKILRQRIEELESKWGMTFAEFAERCREGTLGQDPYSYDVESDFWEWEKLETLLQHYEALRPQWT